MSSLQNFGAQNDWGKLKELIHLLAGTRKPLPSDPLERQQH